MFEAYLKERDGVETIIFDSGFISYRIIENQFYISEYYLKPENRKSPKSIKQMMLRCFDIAVENECESFGCHINLANKNFNEVLLIRLKMGFKIVAAEPRQLALVLPLKDFKWVAAAVESSTQSHKQ